MAAVTLLLLSLTSATDPTDGLLCHVHDLEHDPAVSVSSRPYAGGTFRMVSVVGRQKSVKVTLVNRTDAEQTWLKAHQGALLCLRDPRGEKLYGFYADSTFTPSRVPNRWDVGFSFTEVTFSEAAAA